MLRYTELLLYTQLCCNLLPLLNGNLKKIEHKLELISSLHKSQLKIWKGNKLERPIYAIYSKLNRSLFFRYGCSCLLNNKLMPICAGETGGIRETKSRPVWLYLVWILQALINTGVTDCPCFCYFLLKQTFISIIRIINVSDVFERHYGIKSQFCSCCRLLLWSNADPFWLEIIL